MWGSIVNLFYGIVMNGNLIQTVSLLFDSLMMFFCDTDVEVIVSAPLSGVGDCEVINTGGVAKCFHCIMGWLQMKTDICPAVD